MPKNMSISVLYDHYRLDKFMGLQVSKETPINKEKLTVLLEAIQKRFVTQPIFVQYKRRENAPIIVHEVVSGKEKVELILNFIVQHDEQLESFFPNQEALNDFWDYELLFYFVDGKLTGEELGRYLEVYQIL